MGWKMSFGQEEEKELIESFTLDSGMGPAWCVDIDGAEMVKRSSEVAHHFLNKDARSFSERLYPPLLEHLRINIGVDLAPSNERTDQGFFSLIFVFILFFSSEIRICYFFICS